VNNDAAIDISDGIAVLNWLFGSGEEPASPFADCGVDPTEDELSCEAFGGCG
jgi:hypothetical protein